MAETEIDEYKLDTNGGKKQHILRVSLINGRVSMIIVNMKNKKEKFSNSIRLEQFRNACEAFDTTKTILEAINLIKSTIEGGHILLSEDEEAKNIDIKFNIIIGKKEYPPFVIGLPSDDIEEEEVKTESKVIDENKKKNEVEILPTKFDYQGDIAAAAKYGQSTKNTTEYANPIIQSNVKKPNLFLEYIEPILQVHYPDGTTKSTALPPRIQTADGKKPNINPEQLKSLHEQMARNFNQSVSEFEKENSRSNSVSHKSTSAYSRKTVTSFSNNNNLIESNNNMNYTMNIFNNYPNTNLNTVRSAMKPEVNLSNFKNSNLNNIRAAKTSFNPNDNERGNESKIINKNFAPRDNFNNKTQTFNNIKGMSEYSISSVPNKPLVIHGYYGNIPNPSIKNNINNSTNMNYGQNQNIKEIPRIINQNMNFYSNSNLYQRGMNKSSSTPSMVTLDKANHNFYQQNQSQTQFNFPQNPSQSYIQNQTNNINLRYENQNLIQTYNPHLNQNIYINNSQNFINKSINLGNNQQIPNNILTRHNSSQTPLISQSLIYQNKNQKQFAQQKYQNPQILQEQKKLQMLQVQQKQKIINQKSQNTKMKKNSNQVMQNNISKDINLLNRPGLKIQSPLSQNPQINKLQQKQSQPNEISRNPGKEIYPSLKQSYSQQVIRQKPSFKNEITEQQIALAQMASFQNLQNPGNFNISTVSLKQKFLDKEGNEETQSQYEREDNEKEQMEKEPEQPQEKEEQLQKQINEAEVFENLYRTEEGYIIFRNGLLHGIIHKFAEITDVVSKIQIMACAGVKFNLLFRASEHSDKAKVFHEKCDKHQMTLVLVETSKGVRFGGFTTETWDGNCVKKVDNNAFVFSLDKNKIYDVRKNEYAIGGYPKFGPVFFGCQIRVYDNFFQKGGTTCHRGLNYKTKEDYELNNGEQKYIVKEIEVYDVEVIRI